MQVDQEARASRTFHRPLQNETTNRGAMALAKGKRRALGLPGSGGGSPCTGDSAHSGGTCYTPRTWTVASAPSGAAHTGRLASWTALCLQETPASQGRRGRGTFSPVYSNGNERKTGWKATTGLEMVG